MPLHRRNFLHLLLCRETQEQLEGQLTQLLPGQGPEVLLLRLKDDS